MFFHFFFVTGRIVGWGKLLGDLGTEQVFQKLGLLDAGFSGKASGLNLYLPIVCNIDNDLFHALILHFRCDGVDS